MKSKLVVILAILILGSVASMAFAYPKICIDPGHGGSAPGAVGYTTEKVHNLDCGLKLKDWLNLDTTDSGGGYAWSVIMTRSTDVYLSLSARTTYANSNGADRFISVHANGFSDPAANGSCMFCYTNGSSNSFAMRNLLQNELIAHGGRYNRGNLVANFYVVKYTNMPAVLTENAFCTNYNDAQCLNSSSWRNNVAKGYLHALQRHYGYSAYTPSSHVTLIVDNSDGGFSASGNWWTSSSSSDKYGANYRPRNCALLSDPANWNVSLTASATWTVYAWWPQGSNRASSAPYIVYHSGDSTTVHMNQQTNGGQWNTLGSWSMNSGSNNVKLSCWTSSGSVVIADAIKWYK